MSYYNPDSDNDIFVFTLSTCVHCRRTKELLDSLGVGYGHVEVDMLKDEDMAECLEEIGRYNPAQTFPTTILGSRVVVGFKADDIRQEVEKLKKNQAKQASPST